MSKQMKLNCCLFSIDLNQLITAVVFFPLVEVVFFRDCVVDAVIELNTLFLGAF